MYDRFFHEKQKYEFLHFEQLFSFGTPIESFPVRNTDTLSYSIKWQES